MQYFYYYLTLFTYLAMLFWCVFEVVWMVIESRRVKKRIAQWETLGKKAAKGDTKAFLELIYSGPGKARYK